MDTPLNNGLEEIFAHAKTLPVAEREAWLDEVCANLPELRVEIEGLLRSHDASAFMEDVARSPEIEAELARLKPEEPGEFVGAYQLIEAIGQGGFGTVWLAEQSVPVRRRVALKILKLGMDTREVLARFEQERQALALMDHPSIATVFDAGVTQHGRPFIVMEFVAGARITDFCDSHQLPTRERLDLFIAVCQAVQHAHQKGIIHRDLKPSNILVSIQDGKPTPKIIDFGVAKAMQARLSDITVLTELQQMIGTPPYMSPEQAEGSGTKVDTRTDIYALGVLLYELLTGRAPFEPAALMKASYDEIRRIICEDDPPKPSSALQSMPGKQLANVARQRNSEPPTLIHTVRGDLDWIVMKALEKERARRYETANGFGMDVRRHLQCEPVVARPPSGMYRFHRLVQRNRLLFAAVGAVAAALVAGISASLWHAALAKKANQDTQLAMHNSIAAQRSAEAAAQKEAKARADAVAQERAALELAYAANMNLIQRAWERGEFGLAHRILEQTRQYPRKGFEWYYWQKLCHPELITIRGHKAAITALAVSADGKLVASGDDDGIVIVSDLSSERRNQVLHNVDFSLMNGTLQVRRQTRPRPGDDTVTALAFSPDRRILVIGREFGKSEICDLATDNRIPVPDPFRRDGKGYYGNPRQFIFSADGKEIAIVTDHSVDIWNSKSGNHVRTVKGESLDLWWANPFVSGDDIAVPKLDGTPYSSSYRTSNSPVDPVTGDIKDWIERKIYRFERSPDGRRLMTRGANGSEIWSLPEGTKERTLGNGFTEVFQFSPDSTRIVTAAPDHSAMIVDASTGTKQFQLTGHSDDITSTSYFPDGSRIVTGGKDHLVKIWDARGPPRPVIYPAPSRSPISIFYPDAKRMLIAEGRRAREAYSRSGAITVWDLTTRKKLFTANSFSAVPLDKTRPVSETIDGISLSDDGSLIATSSSTTITIWSGGNGERIRRFGSTSPDPYKRDIYVPLAFSRGNRLITGGYYTDRASEISMFPSPVAALWNVTNGRQTMTFPRFGDGISVVAGSHDSLRVLAADTKGIISLWDAVERRKLFRSNAHRRGVYAAAFFPKDYRFVTASQDGMAKIWDGETGVCLLTLQGHTKEVTSVAVNLDGTRVVTGSEDGTLKIWDATSGRELLTLDAGVPVPSIALSKDGRQIASATSQSPDEILDIPEWFPKLVPPWILKFGVRSGGIRIWDAATDEEIAAWQQEDSRAAEIEIELTERDSDDLTISSFRDPIVYAWVGDAAEHRNGSVSRLSVVSQSNPTLLPDHVDQAVKVYCLLPPENSEQLERSLDAIRKVVSANQDQPDLPWYRLTLGMAEYRAGNFPAADEAFAAVEKADAGNDAPPARSCAALLFHAMSLHSQNRETEARKCFLDAESRMSPIPPVSLEASAQSANHDDLIVWIAYKEAARVLSLEKPGRGGVDIIAALRQATLHAWEGKGADHMDLCKRILAAAAIIHSADDAERAARMYCLRPSSDPALLKAAVMLARKAVSMVGDTDKVPWYQMTLGMAEYRQGNYRDADAALSAARESAGKSFSVKHVDRTAGFYHAMNYFREGKEVEAIECLIKAEMGMSPFRVNYRAVTYESAEDMMLVLARVEANALLQPALNAEKQYKALSNLIETPGTSEKDRSKLLMERSKLLRQLNRMEEAASDHMRSLGIPARTVDADSNTIDLSPHFNAALKGNWHGDIQDNDLNSVPIGVHHLEGIDFDCRGLVQLRSSDAGLGRFPVQVSPIKIGRACREIHFLHACLYGMPGTEGKQIGTYKLHYAGGQTRELPIIQGKDLLDWWTEPSELALANGVVVAWRGANGKSKRGNQEIRLFKSSFKNPLPGVRIESVEFVSTMTKAAPFLVAISVEPVVSGH